MDVTCIYNVELIFLDPETHAMVSKTIANHNYVVIHVMYVLHVHAYVY